MQQLQVCDLPPFHGLFDLASKLATFECQVKSCPPPPGMHATLAEIQAHVANARRSAQIVELLGRAIAAKEARQRIKELDDAYAAHQATLHAQIERLEAQIAKDASHTLTVEELAALLKISIAHAYKCLKDETVPRRRMGTRYIISTSAVMRWLDSAGSET